jgi:phytanoyl-CoA hydroxylase
MKSARFYENPEQFDTSSDPCVRAVIEDGYCVVNNAVDGRLIDEFLTRWEKFKSEIVIQYTDKLIEGEDMIGGRYRRMVNMHLVLPELERLFTKNRALQVTDQLFGESTTLYTSLYFEIGSAQDFHRDTPYFWTNPGYNYFGVWLALEDTDERNGALTAIKGSHRQQDSLDFREQIGKLDPDENGHPKAHSGVLWGNYQKRVQEACLKAGLVPSELHVKKGDVIIWHPQLMHGGAGILDDRRSRNSFVMHVTPKYQVVYAQDKYFDPSAQLPSLDEAIRYRETSGGRMVRDEPFWAISQKVLLPSNAGY